MVTTILVYSLTGNTAIVAQALAERLGAGVANLVAPKVKATPLAVLRLGYATLFGGKTPVQLQGPDPTRADLLILAAPVWAGRLSVPMRTWLAGHPALPRRVALVMTGGNPAPSTTALADFAARAGVTPLATLYLSEARIKTGDFAADCASFCQRLA